MKLADFLSKGFPNTSPEQWQKRFNMWWVNNPNLNLRIPLGWILENTESEIFGFMGNIPVKYQINGKQGIAVGASSFFVNPTLKGIWGIKIIFAFIKQKYVNLCLSTTPNEKIQKMLPHSGFSSLNFPLSNKEYWYIINFENIVGLFLRKLKKSNKSLFYLVKILSFPIKFIFPVTRIIRKKGGKPVESGSHQYSICTFCDDSFTELWEKNKKKYATTLYRDASTLNWLYFSEAVKDKRYVIKCCKKNNNNKLVGYAVFDLRTFRNTNVKIMELRDAYIPKMEEKIVSSLLTFSIIVAKKLNVSALRLWAINQEMNEILRKKIKIRRKCKFNYFYRFSEDEELVIKMQKNHEFIPSPIDPDRGAI